MLSKKESYTVITPIPTFIPRQLALDILHSHTEVITLNPLVLGFTAIPAPRNAAADEYYSTWYEITQQIQYIPGVGKMGSGKINFNGCFHNMPWGLQTHTYAPANVDLRVRYKVGGNQPGIEPPEHPEIGLAALGVPKDGLYLREDIEIKCNIAMVSFVKSQMKAASKEMIARIIKKAELLDTGELQGMFENGQLKTVNPNDHSHTGNPTSPTPTPTPMTPQSYNHPASPPPPNTISPGPGGRASITSSVYANSTATPPPPQSHFSHQQPQQQQSALSKNEFAPMELPGDMYHNQYVSPASPPPQHNYGAVQELDSSQRTSVPVQPQPIAELPQ